MLSTIQKLYEFLLKNKIVIEVSQINKFFDEPRYHHFQAALNSDSPYVMRNTYTPKMLDLATGGLAFESSELGLLKCLVELMERYTLMCCKKKYTFSSYEKLPFAIDPSIYIPIKNGQSFGWLIGESLSSRKKAFIPAQLVYLNYHYYATYKLDREEPRLTQLISTGSAGGVTQDDTILRGIYEVVERDMSMSTYLLHRTLPKIDLESVDNSILQSFLQVCKHMQLEVHAFEMTNDLGIPGVMTFILDKTGIGPEMAIGTKANLNMIDALIGSADEAFMTRIWIRHNIHQGMTGTTLQKEDIKTLGDRGLYWATGGRYKYFSYLFRQKPTRTVLPSTPTSASVQIVEAVAKLKRRQKSVYWIDLTEKDFKRLGLVVTKVIIPGLQPMYIQERLREVNTKRLKELAEFFHMPEYTIEDIPHPFL